MPFVPQTNIKLLHTPLDINGQNQIRFSSVAAQTAYFSGLIVGPTYSGLTYQRRDDILYIPAHVDSLWSVNYVMYQNDTIGGKWFYAYVTKSEYINEECTALTLKTDVFQTWMLSCTLLDSFIVRSMPRGEGASGYMPGDNLIEENLETGEYIMNTGIAFTELNDLSILALASDTYEDIGAISFLPLNGVPCGLYAFQFANELDLRNWITQMIPASKIESIVALFVVPTIMLKGGATPGEHHLFDGDHVQLTRNIGYKPTTIDGYIPKNKKLLTYPYNFLYASNRCGQAAILRYEYFNNNLIEFKIDGGPMPAAEIKLTPANYKGMSINFDESISLTGFPAIGWVSDVFKTWLAQNAYNIPINIASGAVSTIAAGVAGSGVGVAGGILSVASELASIKTHELIPDQARGSTSGSANIGMGIHNFLVIQKSITSEYAERIDQYFTMYGYKQNRVAVPDISSRAHWNYIKTIDCNISGPVPGPDMEELKSLFNAGLTIWANGAEIGNYTLDNYEVV